MRRVVFDTNILIDWLNTGAHEDRVLGRGQVRLLSSIVEMELRAGAFTAAARGAVERLARAHADAARLLVPTASVYAEAGGVLRRLRARGEDVRRASLVSDLLIALSARSIGATLVTRDRDFERIRAHAKFDLELL